MENLNLLFYKTYYEELAIRDGKAAAGFLKAVEQNNAILFGTKFTACDYIPKPIECSSFCMKTAYPGLLIGSGYAHGTGLTDADNDLKVGFTFDYVSGQPYLPGSSVKGMLRSAFRHREMIAQLLQIENMTDEMIGLLEAAIFGTDEDGSGSDVFFDAVVRAGDENGLLLGPDTITPHGTDTTKNPIPVQMVKVLPNVVFEFRFLLHDQALSGGITVTAGKKLNLFKQLLSLLGIGAKTNVGYGRLVPVSANELGRRLNEGSTKAAAPKAQTEEPAQLAVGQVREALVTGVSGRDITFTINGKLGKAPKGSCRADKGQTIRVRISTVSSFMITATIEES